MRFLGRARGDLEGAHSRYRRLLQRGRLLRRGRPLLYRYRDVVGIDVSIFACDLVFNVIGTLVTAPRLVKNHASWRLYRWAPHHLVCGIGPLAYHERPRLWSLDHLHCWRRSRRAVLMRKGVVAELDRRARRRLYAPVVV